MKARISTSLAAACLVLLAGCAVPRAGDDAASLGAGGYDVVAYFTEGEATRGSPQYAVSHGGRE